MINFKLRLILVFKILFKPKFRGIFIEISEKDFEDLLTGEDFNINLDYFNLRKYLVGLLFERLEIPADEMVLLKAEFEAEVDLLLQSEGEA